MLFEVEVFKVFMLVMVRISGLLLTAPVLGSGNFPVRAKAGLAAAMALLITPLVPALSETLPNDFLSLAFLGLSELLIGLTMGLVMTLAFAAIQVAGQLMDMLSGFGLVNVFNPALGTQTPVFGFFFFLIAALYFLAIDGHHMMIRHLAATFDKIPIGAFRLRPELLRDAATWGSAMFVDGLMIAAPIAGALLLAYVTMGLMGRVVPQIHLFVVGFPFTIGLALLMSAFIIQLYLYTIDGIFDRMWGQVEQVVRGLS